MICKYVQIFEGTAKTYFLDETFKIFLRHKEWHEGNDLRDRVKHLGLPFVYETFFGLKLG